MSHEDRSMWEDPDESPAVRQLLRAGRSANAEYDVASGLARHLANIQAGAPAPAWAAAPQTTASSLLAWLLPPIIGASVIGTWLWIRPAEPTQPTLTPVTASAATALPNDVQPSAAMLPALPSAPSHPVNVPAQAESAPVARYGASARAASPIATKHAALSSRSARRAHARRESAEAEPREREVRASGSSESSAPLEFTTPFVVPAVSNVSNAPSESRTRQSDRAEPAAQEAKQDVRPNAKEQELAPAKLPAVPDSKLEREMQMLAVAQRVLVDDPSRALKLARQGEQEFRGSMFSAERKQVSLLALVQLGRLDEARRLGRPFLRAYPNAPWSARLREALGSGQLPTR